MSIFQLKTQQKRGILKIDKINKSHMKTGKIIKLIISILICQAAGIVGSIFTSPAIPTWYAKLVKSGINPPNWIFAPAWTTLFLLMGIAFYIVWEKGKDNKNFKPALFVFFVQLALNTLWSFLFFGLRSSLLGLLGIILLWIAILVTISNFQKISKTAALLLLPYILWVTFAAILNFFIWQFN
jgi:tryptophan-rich sensory protein